jgi:predicted alpha/beta-hydrolase family hydrolase
VTVREVETAFGLGRVNVQGTAEAGAALVLGHGAGGGVQAVDLVAASEVALEMGLVVARVEQPYRVAGRRSPPRAPQLDGAWIALVEQLRANELAAVSLIVGGRSLGARVACRTSAATGAVAVLCLAFPLEPPRRGGSAPPSRLPELEAVSVPTLVVQGISDRFGIPPRAPLGVWSQCRATTASRPTLLPSVMRYEPGFPTSCPYRRTSLARRGDPRKRDGVMSEPHLMMVGLGRRNTCEASGKVPPIASPNGETS